MTTVDIRLRLRPAQIATLRALCSGTTGTTVDRHVGAMCDSVIRQLDRQRSVWDGQPQPQLAARVSRAAGAKLEWHGTSAIGDDGTKYTLQVEHVRGEPPYYTVWVMPPHETHYQTELTNERSMGCTPARARRIAALHAARITAEAGGYSTSSLQRGGRHV